MQFLNQSLGFFNKGCFEPIDRDFITESYQALKPIEEIQNKYNKHDNDSFLNELRDSMVALYLDYKLINIQKHGLDAKRSSSDEFLEIKQVSFQSQLIKEFEFKMKPIDSKEQELINLFNLKFGRFSWENYLA
ncbi:hypothetical protein KVE63_01280 [Helicobacter pylori]|uniref:Uncharacterized protein n=1 Tax=Helicobacter pylori TaxID=210 RepID=A0AAW9KH66_HELPX|nr:hypothetical protein [Helicobacter pylori]MDZ7550773.1 hypothetical protein [Helicobacter pylori]TPH36590.1 hypothetical protein FIM84_01605 [Helicobacter pylori]WRE53329.1 hypothetical protein KVE63_01280 [Helicobacter pylori]